MELRNQILVEEYQRILVERSLREQNRDVFQLLRRPGIDTVGEGAEAPVAALERHIDCFDYLVDD